MPSRTATSPSRAKRGDQPTASAPSDSGANSASELIEAPLSKQRDPLDPHDFADGGGGGGAEAYRRTRRKK